MKRLNKKFIEKLEKIYTKKELETIKDGFNTKNPTVFRLNTLKTDFDVIKSLTDYGFKIEKLNFLENGYIIKENGKIRISDTKAFKKGYIYLQGITSQIPIELIDLPKKLDNFKILDLTAAPGGKTTQIAVKMNNKGHIVANENNLIRTEKLKFTINKQDVKDIEVIKFDANNLKEHYTENYFDVIIADLPCSAEGKINLEKEKTYKYLEKAGINKRNYKRQQSILKNNIKLLKSGGQLIYSTCTLDPTENEGIINYLLFEFPELKITDISEYFGKKGLKEISKSGILKYKKQIYKPEVAKSYRILPSKNTEGFFVAKLIKN